MLKVLGTLFFVLGLTAGAALVTTPFGALSGRSSLTVALLFPICCSLGVLLIALGSDGKVMGTVWRTAGAALLGLAFLAGAGLFVAGSGAVPLSGSANALWLVLGVGTVFGTLGLVSDWTPPKGTSPRRTS